jgi:PAS domain S-box-containing protein
MQRLTPALQAYLAFLDTLPDAAIVADDQAVVLANARGEALLGQPPGGLDGMPLAEIATDVRPESSLAAPANGTTDPEHLPRAISLRHRDGHTVVAEIARNRVVLDGRSLILSVLRDDTDRRRAEEAVRTSEELLRQAVLVANLGVFDHDQVRDEIYWSPEQRAIHGWGPDQPVTLADFVNLVHPDDRAWVAETVARAHDPAGDGKWEVEHRIVRPDGEVRWLLSRSQTFFERRGGTMQPVRTVGAVADVTEQRVAADVLQMFRTSIDQASDAIFWLRPDGSISYVNGEACRLLGYTREEMDHVRIWDIDPAYTPEAWAARWAEFERTRRRVIERVETRQRRKDGTTFPVEVVIQHLPVGDSTLHVAYERDLTERQRLEAQLLQAQKMEAIGQLAGGVAHDFNNLLTATGGYAQQLRDEIPIGDPKRADLDQIVAASERGATLVRQLLAVSRRQVLQPRVLDLNGLVQGIVPMLRRLLGERIELTVALAEHLGHVMTDPGQIEQVILNLAVNARDAMPNGGRLSIETANVELDEAYARGHASVAPGPYVLLAAIDTGVGMDGETLEHMFEPFFTTKAPDKGTGLGLATVYGIVRQSGGHVGAHSGPGQGTSFKVYLPRVDQAAEPYVATRPDGAVGRGSETILLVEDDEAIRVLATRVLERQGYRVLGAAHAAEAMALPPDELATVDLMVTDVILPGANGPELVALLTDRLPGLRVLYVSGYAEQSVLANALNGVGGAFLTKPFSPDALARKVRELLDAPEA